MVCRLQAPSVPALMRGEGDAFCSSPPARRLGSNRSSGTGVSVSVSGRRQEQKRASNFFGLLPARFCVRPPTSS